MIWVKNSHGSNSTLSFIIISLVLSVAGVDYHFFAGFRLLRIFSEGCGVVVHERLTEPRVTIEWLLIKPKSFENLPAFLDLNDSWRNSFIIFFVFKFFRSLAFKLVRVSQSHTVATFTFWTIKISRAAFSWISMIFFIKRFSFSVSFQITRLLFFVVNKSRTKFTVSTMLRTLRPVYGLYTRIECCHISTLVDFIFLFSA